MSMAFIDIFNSQLSASPSLPQNWPTFFNSTELANIAHYRHAERQNLYIHQRLILKQLLSGYLNTPGRQINIALHAHGKPYLPDHHLFFNLSHTGLHLAIAISNVDNIGIDIERVNPKKDVLRLAKRFFTPAEHRYLNTLPAEQQHQAFYQLWTKKEAFVKAVGRGLALGLNQFEIALPEGESLSHIPNLYGQAQQWRIQEFSPDQDTCGALVYPAINCRIAVKHL
jgi:4'-phosphopantetheinyl transferase